MQMTCPNCERLMRTDDEIVATVVAFYRELGSKKVYSISTPTSCLDIRHRNCNYVKGCPEGV